MRSFLIPVLMASAMVPVAAAARERDGFADRARDRAEQSERSTSSDDKPQPRQERPERAVRAERRESTEVQKVQRVERTNRVRQVEAPAETQTQTPTEARTQTQSQTQTQTPTPQVPVVRRSGDGLVEGLRSAVRQQEAERAGTTTRTNRDGHDGRHDHVVRNGDKVDNHKRWSSNWRKDHRYNWHSYRNQHRSIFRLGSYYDPYGYGYRRFSTGYNLWPSYYSSSNWLNDPWMYRLPPAYGPYRWIRYYDDALLVNIYTGQVVDVLNNFFW